MYQKWGAERNDQSKLVESPYKQPNPFHRPNPRYSSLPKRQYNFMDERKLQNNSHLSNIGINYLNSYSQNALKLPPIIKEEFNTDQYIMKPIPRNLSQSVMMDKPSDKFSNQVPPLQPKVQSQIQQYTELDIRCGCSTLAGLTVQGTSKINQDSIIIDRSQGLFAVADGHGLGGEKISGFLRVWIPKNLSKVLPKTLNNTAIIKDAFHKAFRQTNGDLWNSFECSLAGSTLTLVWIPVGQNQKLYTANVGDSRIVMGKQLEHGWAPIELTRDQKPSVDEEARRIVQSGGRVAHQVGRVQFYNEDAFGHPLGPLRVWLKNVQAPGLAMTRSFGDKLGAQAGVTAVPGLNQISHNLEVLEFGINKQDRFIVVASDGVWEYQSNHEIISFAGALLNQGFNAQQISERIVQRSIESWKQNSLARDDISCIVILLD